ncbi:hypothetical protein XENOCAPTIV_012166 [Xenoophorus captivus]|uniref:Secreted protein n=1 Tax=Xenoophorus captivus TaxID=1517983 RepID=A0ABV0R3K8_9TELE
MWCSLTVQPSFLPIHSADLGVGVLNGGVVVRHKVGLWDTFSVSEGAVHTHKHSAVLQTKTSFQLRFCNRTYIWYHSSHNTALKKKKKDFPLHSCRREVIVNRCLT